MYTKGYHHLRLAA